MVYPPPPPKCGSGRGCNAAQSAAITVIPGVVFSGSVDGVLRGYSTKDGAIIWEFDTNREFQTSTMCLPKEPPCSGQDRQLQAACSLSTPGTERLAAVPAMSCLPLAWNKVACPEFIISWG